MGDKIYLSPPYQSGKELKSLKKVFKSNWLAPNGEQSKLFRSEIRVRSLANYAVLTNSGTSAIHLALQLVGVEPDDEVICPSYTFAACVFPILYQSAKPVFIDVDSKSWNINPDLLEMAIDDRLYKGKKPKAILLAHNYGNPVDFHRIKLIAEYHEIPIIEDAAEALGATYEGEMAGNLGDIGIYSFNANKIVTTSGGGALLCDNKEFYTEAFKLSNQSKELGQNFYLHEKLGYNYTMSDVQASIGLTQLQGLDERVKRKREIFENYKKAFEDFDFIGFQEEESKGLSNRWLSCIRINPSSGIIALDLKNELNKDNIETRLSWNPLHLQNAFTDHYKYVDGTSEQLFESVLCLPSGVGLSRKEQRFVIKKLKSLLT